MKVFGKEVGKVIKLPPFIERFRGKILPIPRIGDKVKILTKLTHLFLLY
ncbi:hypothetical protein [Aquimarina aggregata]|nr:hypothetical protein [Aquimarina aggregata]